VGLNARGDAVVMWAQSDTVQLVVRRAGERFGARQSIVARRAVPGDVVVDARGGAVAAWTASGRVYASRRSPGHRFRHARVLNPGGPGGGRATVAVGADGTVVVAWRAAGSAFAAVGEPGEALGPAQRLAGFYPYPSFYGPAAVVTGAGEALVAWTQGVHDPAGDRTEVAIAVRSPGGAFGAPHLLSAAGVSADGPALAGERHGTVVAAWSEAGPIGPSGQWWVATAVRPGGARDFLPSERLRGAAGANAPAALLGADASTLVLWRVGDGPLLASRRGE
jgi:hypothetical protein